MINFFFFLKNADLTDNNLSIKVGQGRFMKLTNHFYIEKTKSFFESFEPGYGGSVVFDVGNVSRTALVCLLTLFIVHLSAVTFLL